MDLHPVSRLCSKSGWGAGAALLPFFTSFLGGISEIQMIFRCWGGAVVGIWDQEAVAWLAGIYSPLGFALQGHLQGGGVGQLIATVVLSAA